MPGVNYRKNCRMHNTSGLGEEY